MVERLASGGLMKGSRWSAEALSSHLLAGEPPATLEALLERLHGARDDLLCAHALVRLALHALGPPQRTATVPGNFVVSNRREGGVPSPLLVVGNLHVLGSLDLDVGAWLVCTGELRVAHATVDRAPGALLAVGGSLTTARMSTQGDVAVGGTLTVEDTLLAWGQGRLVSEGPLRAGLLVNGGHTVDTPLLPATRVGPGTDGAGLRQHLVDSVLTRDGERTTVDATAVDQWLRANRSPRRA
ncbi:hypothetical protein DRW03_06090 [Corallococcus sp. H22C18031201]|nr:hypothetical protein DRW03_06090 [Corallococcus sp. H22C18031201]